MTLSNSILFKVCFLILSKERLFKATPTHRISQICLYETSLAKWAFTAGYWHIHCQKGWQCNTEVWKNVVAIRHHELQ